MIAPGTSLIVVACRRGLMVLFCALTFMLALASPHEAADLADSSRAGRLAFQMATDDQAGDQVISGFAWAPPLAAFVISEAEDPSEQGLRPDALPCHSVGHSCGQLAPVRTMLIAGVAFAEERTSSPLPNPAHALLPGPSALPTEPPRA